MTTERKVYVVWDRWTNSKDPVVTFDKDVAIDAVHDRNTPVLKTKKIRDTNHE